MKYIGSDYYNEWVMFEHQGQTHTRDLYAVYEDDYRMRGLFEFEGKEYILTKELELDDADTTVLVIKIKEVK